MLYTIRRTLPFVLLLTLLTTGCDSGGSNDKEDTAYLGTWEKEGEDQYMHLSDEQMVVYARFTSDCYSTFTFDVVSRNGETWQLNDPGDAGETIEVSVDGDDLTLVEDDGDVVQWTRTDIDPDSDLDLCE